MKNLCYIAMTGAEFFSADTIAEHPAWMACQFSPYTKGLANLPKFFPENCMIILNDAFPYSGHDLAQIVKEMEDLSALVHPAHILLDFQRPGVQEVSQLARLLCQALPCPVGVSHLYAGDLDCPVFLPPPPPYKSLQDGIAQWSQREIWLELASETACLTVTQNGCQVSLGADFPETEPVFFNEDLFCHYHTEVFPDKAVFRVERTSAMLLDLLQQNDCKNITCSVGLYQSQKAP